MTAPAPDASLELLGDELSRRGLVATLAPDPAEDRPVLEVTSRARYGRTHPVQVMCTSGWFWTPWAERIAPATHPADAADYVARAFGA
jgi:hypothetical protein